jgi:hypothetical protein
VRPGTSSSISHGASCPSDCANGRTGSNHWDLVLEVISAINHLMEKWRQLTANKEDAAAVVAELIITIDREWPPHAFDRIVERAVAEIGLLGLDCIKYRDSRLDTWRELVGFFETREHAEAAMNAAIRRELEHLFGNRAALSMESATDSTGFGQKTLAK